jgi:hypothetical protein
MLTPSHKTSSSSQTASTSVKTSISSTTRQRRICAPQGRYIVFWFNFFYLVFFQEILTIFRWRKLNQKTIYLPWGAQIRLCREWFTCAKIICQCR